MSSAKTSGLTSAEAGRSPITQWINSFGVGGVTTMSWVHVTAVSIAQIAVKRGYLLPERCDYFGRDLTYLNYGRPAYPLGGDRLMNSGLFGPVVFIFNPIIERRGVLLFPFDSGAFRTGRYTRWIPREYPLDNYAMIPGDDAPRRLICGVYGSNEAYWIAQVDESIPFQGPVEARALMDMYRDPGVEAG
ncbi:hypothetical protein ACW9YV_10975 [Paraburkholderia strydomiana]